MLPREVLDGEIREIENTGVEIRTNARVESLDVLMLEEGYDAVLVALGAQDGYKPSIAGADLDGVWVGLEFLREIHLGRRVQIGKKLLVLGGGNVAFDCARVARRLGAEQVNIACLEHREVMPADMEEIAQGEEEGIIIHPSRTFKRILGEQGKVIGVECLDAASFEFDEDGNAHIDAVEGSEHILPADTVIFAVGQRPRIPEAFGLDLDGRGRIEVDPYTFDTNEEGVFAAGDAVTGMGSVIGAIASGRKGAAAVDRYLGGDGDIDEHLAPFEEPQAWLGPGDGFAGMNRVKANSIRAEDRIKNFCGIRESMGEEAALSESSRCLQCDLRLRITPVRFWGDY